MTSPELDRVEVRRAIHPEDLVAWCDRAILVVIAATGILLPITFGPWDDAFGFPKTLLLVAVAVVVLGLLAVRLLVGGGFGSLSLVTIDAIAGAFLLLVLVSWLLSADRTQSFFGERYLWQGAMATVAYATFYVAVRTEVSTHERLIRVLALLVAGGCLVALFAWVQWLGWDPLWMGVPGGRVFSTVGQPNALATYLVMIVPLGLALSRQGSRPLRMLGFAAAGMSVGAIGATLSRGGLVGLMVATFVFGLTSWQRGSGSRRRSLAVAVIASVVVGSVLIGGGSELIDRTAAVTDLGSYESQQRLALWEVGAAIAMDNQLIGAGPATYPVLFDAYRTEVLDPYWADVLAAYRPESPHNVYLAIAAGSGLPALAAYLGVMLGALRSTATAARHLTARTRWIHAGIAAAIAGHLSSAMFMSAEVTSSWMVWILAGLGVTSSIRSRRSGVLA